MSTVPVTWNANGRYIREGKEDFHYPGQTGEMEEETAEKLAETNHLRIGHPDEDEANEEPEAEAEPEEPAPAETEGLPEDIPSDLSDEELVSLAEIVAEEAGVPLPEYDEPQDLHPFVEEYGSELG